MEVRKWSAQEQIKIDPNKSQFMLNLQNGLNKQCSLFKTLDFFDFFFSSKTAEVQMRKISSKSL